MILTKNNWCVFLLTITMLSVMIVSCHPSRKITKVQNVAPVVEVKVAEPVDSIFAIYQRSPCFGMCPYFDLTIYKSGFAIYEGKNFVNKVGFYRTIFSTTDLEKILSAAQGIDYFSLNDTYDNSHITDLPTVTTGVEHKGKMKTVSARYQAPKELETMYQVLDELISEAEWTPMDSIPAGYKKQ